MYTRHIILMEMLLGVLFLIVALSFINRCEDNIIIAVCLALNVFILNVSSYMNFINQFTCRFKFNLINNSISKLLQVITISVCIIFSLDKAYYFIFIITFTNLIYLLCNSYQNNSIISFKGHIFNKKSIIRRCYQSGLPIMLGYQASLLIMSLGQFVVRHNFSSQIFAYYTFSFSIMAFVNVFVNAISTWVFPYLKRLDSTKLEKVFTNLGLMVVLFVGMALSTGFIVEIIIKRYLVKYLATLPYLEIMYPIVLVNSLVKIVEVNAFKIYKKEKEYMWVNIVVFLVAVIGNLALIESVQNPFWVAVLSVFIIIIYLVSMVFELRKDISLNGQFRNIAYMLIIIANYYFVVFRYSELEGFSMYFLTNLIFVAIILLNNKREGNIPWKF